MLMMIESPLYIFYDLEWNQTRDIQGRVFNEIIEIGAIKTNELYEEIDRFHCYIKPRFSREEISLHVYQLTKLTPQKLMKEGQPFEVAIQAFFSWAGKGLKIPLISWGQADQKVLTENIKQFLPNMLTDRREINGQRIIGDELKVFGFDGLGLRKAAEHCGLDLTEFIAHQALEDACIVKEIFIKTRPRQDYLLKEGITADIDLVQTVKQTKQNEIAGEFIATRYVKNSRIDSFYFIPDQNQYVVERKLFRRTYYHTLLVKTMIKPITRENFVRSIGAVKN